MADRVAGVPGVAAVKTYRHMQLEVKEQPLALVSRDLLVHAEWNRYLFVSGECSEIFRRTVDEDGVIVSEVLAATLGLEPGDQLTLPTPVRDRSFPVTGVFYDYTTDWGKAVMDRSLFRRLWQDDTTTVIHVNVRPDADPSWCALVSRKASGGDEIGVKSNWGQVYC